MLRHNSDSVSCSLGRRDIVPEELPEVGVSRVICLGSADVPHLKQSTGAPFLSFVR